MEAEAEIAVVTELEGGLAAPASTTASDGRTTSAPPERQRPCKWLVIKAGRWLVSSATRAASSRALVASLRALVASPAASEVSFLVASATGSPAAASVVSSATPVVSVLPLDTRFLAAGDLVLPVHVATPKAAASEAVSPEAAGSVQTIHGTLGSV